MTGSGPGWARSHVVGAIIGAFAGALVIFLVEAAGHRLLGTADPADYSSVTTAMFMAVLFAWVAGSWVGGAVATYWSRSAKLVPGLIVGLVLLAAAVTNMFVIVHPVWMIVSAVILMPTAAILGARQVRGPASGTAV